MSNTEPLHPSNQIGQAAFGKFYVIWRGRTVYENDGTVRKFLSEARAWEYLAECDRLEREVD